MQTGTPVVSIDMDSEVHDEALAFLCQKDARELHVLPLKFNVAHNQLVIAAVSVDSVKLTDRIQKLLRGVCRFKLVKMSGKRIAQGLNKSYGSKRYVDAQLQVKNTEIGMKADGATAPVVALIEAILKDALAFSASDIHMTPEDNVLTIRFRINGVLSSASDVPISLYAAMLVRLKVIANLDISESRIPQEGLISCRLFGELMNFRLSTYPVRTGECVVVRILDTEQTWRKLDDLVYPSPALLQIERCLKQSQGLVVICGPTGSGKTTTLYAILQMLESELVSVMTLEDPIEFPLPRVRQSSVGSMSKMGLAEAIKGALRQDPDVLLIGELRDPEACAQCIRASLSGRLLLTTVHAASSIMAVHRLVELCGESTLVADSITAVISQRLVRTVCVSCAGEKAGCMHCQGVGYGGRFAIFEVLEITDQLRELIRMKASSQDLKTQAVADGYRPIGEAALDFLSNRIIDAYEYERVIGPLS